jgi:hypothetical protein
MYINVDSWLHFGIIESKIVLMWPSVIQNFVTGGVTGKISLLYALIQKLTK